MNDRWRAHVLTLLLTFEVKRELPRMIWMSKRNSTNQQAW